MTSNNTTLDDTQFDMNRKKKSKKRIIHDIQPETTAIADSTDHMAEDERVNDLENDYDYHHLLTRAFCTIGDHQCKLYLPPPQLGRIGTKRTSFTNFGSICKCLNRQEKLLYDYFIVELGTTASIDAHHALILKGRWTQTNIEKVLRSFISDYIICKSCRSPDTLLEKVDRLTRVKCNACHSKYTVLSIRIGCQAPVNKRT